MVVTIVAFSVLLALLALNVPISFSIGIAAMAAFIAAPTTPVIVLAQRMYFGLDTFTLIAVPLFMLAGRLMTRGGVTRDLLDLSSVLVGFLRGGLAYINILSSVFFSGITGTAASDTASTGGIMIPAMLERGYEKDFTVAVTATSSTIAILLPPSLPMLLYGVTANQSIGKLFIGGIVPGLMTAFALMFVTFLLARKRNYPREAAYTFSAGFRVFLRSIPALTLIIIVLGGIRSGFFTPTEAAGFSCLYSLCLGVFYYRQLKWSDIPGIVKEVSITLGIVAMMVAPASALGWIFAQQNLPAIIGNAILAVTDNEIIILILINLLLLFVGMWMDLVPSIIIFTPILLPIVESLGIDPVHFGVIMVLNLGIGLFTPPSGVCLFIACGIAKVSISSVLRAFFPYLIAMLVVLTLITYFPVLCMTLPNWLM